MKHDLIKELYYEWQDYNEFFNGFIYFNEFWNTKVINSIFEMEKTIYLFIS